eukprot:2673849-Lingulodinium_polyedra.AAC.1
MSSIRGKRVRPPADVAELPVDVAEPGPGIGLAGPLRSSQQPGSRPWGPPGQPPGSRPLACHRGC